MAQPHFKRTHDVQSYAKFYQESERRQMEREEKKRQRKREEQRKQQQTSILKPSALATSLERDPRASIVTENQTSSHTSNGPPDFPLSIDEPDSNLTGALATAESYDGPTMGDLAHTTRPFASILEIDGFIAETAKYTTPDGIKSSEHWSPCASVLPQLPTGLTSQQVTVAAAQNKQPLVPSPVRSSTGQLRLAGCVPNDVNECITQDKATSENGDTCENIEDDGSVNDDNGSSDDDDTDRESFLPDGAFREPQFIDRHRPRTFSTSKSAPPDPAKSPLYARSSVSNFSIDDVAVSLEIAEECQPDIFALPTPSSDHPFVSQQGGDVIISQRKRGHEACEEGHESDDLCLPKRKRSRNPNETTATNALSVRTLRALPSRVLAEKPGRRGVPAQCERHIRRSLRSKPRSHASGAVSCQDAQPHLDGLPSLDVDNASNRGKRTRTRRGRSQTTPQVTSPRSSHSNHSSGKPNPQKNGRDCLPPAATTVNSSSATCHTCGFSAEHLLQISDTVEALTRSGAELSGNARESDILRLFLGFVRDHATQRLPRKATITGNCDAYNGNNQEQIREATVGLPNSETVKDDESSDGNSEDSDVVAGTSLFLLLYMCIPRLLIIHT
ncbi:uncharacterized protein BDZ83DRAFT_118245 [Colletotrichum acutatum]|uniref:Uncharacterized protein n=1 Tax=Glomerella acutata TaxID=27357 RepID=A0AAD8U7S4_GLOAC|nr:uncharacterized protein BDZ83DRAFT_118245 [Colletotrichum acutatum]KAK1711253.1 hypothetical protein BDZ83DRAFT_118245 [Colletotrichum acutatum]